MGLLDVIATEATSDCDREMREAEDLMARDGGDPATGMTVTFAVEDADPDVTVAEQST